MCSKAAEIAIARRSGPKTGTGPPRSIELNALAACVDRLAALGCVAAETINALQEKIASQRFDLVVAGQFKRGKTSLVNALLGAELLPVSVVPLTSVVTAVSHGVEPSASIVLQTGETKSIALAALPGYVTEQGNPGNQKGVREALVRYPSPWLQGGLRLIDTPGVGSVYEHNTDAAHRFLPKADAVIFLLSVDQPLAQAECDFLKQIRRYSEKLFFVLNKIDLLTESELAQSLAFTRDALAKVLDVPPKLFPLSTRLAMGIGAPRSGMPTLLQALGEFMAHERDAALVASIARQASRALSETRFDSELELKSLSAPLHELDRKAALFRQKKVEILRAKDDLELLLVADAKRALHAPLNNDIEAFKEELKRRLVTNVESLGGEHHGIPLRSLHLLLEDQLKAQVREAFDAWQAGESATLERTFEASCARHAATIDEIVDGLFRYAADLFAIARPGRSEAAIHSVESHFYYKFWSEPPSLRILTWSLVFALPRRIGTRMVIDRARRYAMELVETQAGRMRYDFSRRIDQAVAAFRQSIEAKVDTATQGIETAIAKASKLHAAGLASVADRQDALSSKLRALDGVAACLAAAVGADGRLN